MKVVFVDFSEIDYDTDTPYRAPLGGTQSAAAYLAVELVARGVDVAFINNVKTARTVRGVPFHGLDRISGAFLNQFDVVVMLSVARGKAFRELVGVVKPLVLWVGHAADQPYVESLKDPDELGSWSAMAMVSEWQAMGYHKTFGVPRERMAILRNAVAPVFLEAPPARPWFLTGEAPVLAYTSTPFRGLDVLLRAFPAIRKAIPEARLRVFSSLAVYGVPLEGDGYAALYDFCRALPGAEYVGGLPQPELARELRSAAALAYPSTFAETSSIAVMEAMASGAMILSSRLGAVPETSHGFGRLMELEGSPKEMAAGYAAMVIDALRAARADPEGAAARLAEQVAFTRTAYTWAARAQEWHTWMLALIAQTDRSVPARA